MRGAPIALVLALLGCGGGGAEHGTAHEAHGERAAHAHVAPHGGLLIALGDEVAHVELLLDPGTGELSAWLLDAEAERPLRSAQDALVVRLAAGEVRLLPVASALTGESAGDTSEFRARAPELAGATLEGVIERVEVLGRAFEDVAIRAEG